MNSPGATASGRPAPRYLADRHSPVVEAQIADAVARGEAEAYPAADAITLLPLEASRLGVRPNPSSTRWVAAASTDPWERLGRHRTRTFNPAGLEKLTPDPRPTPDHEAAILEAQQHHELAAAELAARVGTAKRTIEPPPFARPVGLDAQWPADGRRPAGRPCGPRCRACNDRPLGPVEVCVQCDRSGLDTRQPADARKRKRKPGPKQQPAPKPGRRLTALLKLKAAKLEPMGGR